MRTQPSVPVPRRALVAIAVLAATVVAGALVPAPARAASDPLAEATAKITAARKAAQASAQRYEDAEAKQGRIDGQIRATDAKVAKLEAEKRRLAGIVRGRAAAAYMREPTTFADLVATSDVMAAARRAALLNGANEQSNAAIDQLVIVTGDLHQHQHDLAEQMHAQRQTIRKLKVEQQKLQQAISAAVKAEQDLKKQLEDEQKLREYAALLQLARDAAGNDGPTVGTPGIIIATGGWVCPVQGPVYFVDSWGAPRSGGRTHKGVDMFAAKGTPLVAVTSGSVFFQGDPLGGNAAYVVGDDGISYYYAHLDDYVGGRRRVKAGELIGHVGNTGDADGGSPHLHFEIRPGGPGAPAIPPYATVRAHC